MPNIKYSSLDLHGKISGINWNQVYSFSLVATYGSIKKAAELLKLSPSTLSEQISQLETILEVELFVRRGPKLTLTEQGKRLFMHAKGMFEHGLRLLDAVTPLHIENYPVSIGFVPGPHLPLAYKWISKFHEEFGPNNMKLQHSSPETFESSLLKGQFDFGFSDKKPNHPELLFQQIDQSAVRFYVSADWNHQSLAELLKRLPLLVCRSEASTEALIEHSLQEADIIPSSIISSDFPSVLVDLCRMGVGIGAFCEEPILKLNTQSIRSLRNPKDAPKIETRLFVIWASAAENTVATAQLKKVFSIKDKQPISN